MCLSTRDYWDRTKKHSEVKKYFKTALYENGNYQKN